jgi:hypothetical protein
VAGSTGASKARAGTTARRRGSGSQHFDPPRLSRASACLITVEVDDVTHRKGIFYVKQIFGNRRDEVVARSTQPVATTDTPYDS